MSGMRQNSQARVGGGISVLGYSVRTAIHAWRSCFHCLDTESRRPSGNIGPRFSMQNAQLTRGSRLDPANRRQLNRDWISRIGYFHRCNVMFGYTKVQ